MSTSENIALMNRWYREVWREGKNETIHELLAPDAVVSGHSGPEGVIRGPAEFQVFAENIRAMFPDTDVVVEDAFGIDDKVAVRWRANMTHDHEAFGVPPTGTKVSVSGTSIVQFADGKIVAGWDNWDRLGLLEQIGAYSAPAAPVLAKTA